jgi:hypothetical protein
MARSKGHAGTGLAELLRIPARERTALPCAAPRVEGAKSRFLSNLRRIADLFAGSLPYGSSLLGFPSEFPNSTNAENVESRYRCVR